MHVLVLTCAPSHRFRNSGSFGKEGRKKEAKAGRHSPGGRKGDRACPWRRKVGITIVKRARTVRQDLPLFTAPSHQGELKKKKLRWEQLGQTRECEQASHFISLPARGWAVLQTTAFPLLCKTNSAELYKRN